MTYSIVILSGEMFEYKGKIAILYALSRQYYLVYFWFRP